MKLLNNIPDTDIAWLAGIWDGEGTIGLNKVKKKTPRGYEITARASLGNTDILMINKVQSILDLTTIKHHTSLYKDKKYLNAKPIYRLAITNYKNIIDFCTLLEPYLVTKKERSLLVKKYCVYRQEQIRLNGNKNNGSYDGSELTYYDSIKKLNMLGVEKNV